MHLWVKKLKVEIFTQTSLQSFPQVLIITNQTVENYSFVLGKIFLKNCFSPTERYELLLMIYLFIFNFFNVDIFISITTRIAFHEQQGQSQTPGSVNKIAECWYPWYQTFETKSLFVVLIKVDPKLKKQQKKQTNKKKHATNWQLTLYHNEEK